MRSSSNIHSPPKTQTGNEGEICQFFSTKSEKGPQCVGVDARGSASRKMASAPEEARRQTEAPNGLSESGSSGRAAGEVTGSVFVEENLSLLVL